LIKVLQQSKDCSLKVLVYILDSVQKDVSEKYVKDGKSRNLNGRRKRGRKSTNPMTKCLNNSNGQKSQIQPKFLKIPKKFKFIRNLDFSLKKMQIFTIVL
jgi:hypothetical protein